MITQTSRETFQVPMPDVFAYITTPATWVEWYPGTSSVNGPEHPAKEDECWEECLRVSGFNMNVEWVAKQVRAPRVCIMEGKMRLSAPLLGWLSRGATVVLRYELLDAGADTCLERTMSYNFPNPLLRLADRLFLQRKTERETREALSNLRQILEARLAHQD